MKRFRKTVLCFLLASAIMTGFCPAVLDAETDSDLTLLYLHDSHDYLYPTTTIENGEAVEHGGAAKLMTVIRENTDEDTIFLDAGDFAMGTLFQAAYSTDAYELRNLGLCGCSVTTFGNHEFDYGAEGTAKMLRAALASGDPLPQIVQSNIDFSGDLTAEQKDLKEAFDEYGVKDHTILSCAGYRIGVFGLVGYDSIECIQTDLAYIDYIKAAREQVSRLKEEGCDIIIALSHSGTNGDGKTGEDFDLAQKVPDIDIIVSAHSHSLYPEPVREGKTIIVSCGEYLKYVGKINVSKKDGELRINSYELIPLDASVTEDTETKARFEEYKYSINQTYLYSREPFDKIIAHSNFNFISLNEMYATHQEYPLGDLIADSYLYEAKKNGIDDIDVALVGLGTVRGSIREGDISVADAFEICSLGVGADGSAGHPIIGAYITGKELKLLTELDASLGELVSSVKMSYSGLSYSFNTKRIILDRVSRVELIDDSGQIQKIEEDKLYKVAANMYALNMLGMLNGLTKGILSITPKDQNGEPLTDFYSMSLKDKDGNEIKEWVAFSDYLESFEIGESGYPEIPERYAAAQGRKVKESIGGLAVITHNGTATRIVPLFLLWRFIVTVLIIALIVWRVKVRKKKKAEKFADRQ